MAGPEAPSRLTSWKFSDTRAAAKSSEPTAQTAKFRRRRSFGDLLRRLSSARHGAHTGRDVGGHHALKLALEQLPEDILLEITSILDVRSILKVAMVSQHIYKHNLASELT